MTQDRPDLRDAYASSIRRDSWRAQLLHEELAVKSLVRARAIGMRWCVAGGVMLGSLGSALIYL